MKKIVRLEKRVGEFGVRNAFFGILDAIFYEITLEHRIYREMFSHIAQEFDEVQTFQPVRIIEKHEVSPAKKLFCLRGDSFTVRANLFRRKKWSLGILSTG